MAERSLDITVLAGEPSGDALGGRLMKALIERSGGAIQFRGVGGETMAALGLESSFPMVELSVMGLAEIVPRAPHLLKRIRQTVAAVREARPDALITIDAPGFNFRVARRLAGCGIPLIHYVAPSVWAWRPGRAREIAGFLDHLLALLPFEPPYFEAVGLPCTFVGHPVVENEVAADGSVFRARHRVPPDAPLLALLPGSRRAEVERLLPLFVEAAARLGARLPGLHIVAPTVPAVAAAVAEGMACSDLPVVVVNTAEDRAHALAASDAALAASGTVTLELAAAAVPMVVAYRLNPATAVIARRLITVNHMCLVNIILDRPVVPELIQEACTPDRLESAVARILVDPRARAGQIEAAREAVWRLRPDGAAPSVRAAETILGVIGRRTAMSPRDAIAGARR